MKQMLELSEKDFEAAIIKIDKFSVIISLNTFFSP